MIIDCHGHYTTAPAPLQKFRDEQIAGLKNGIDVPLSAQPAISDDQIRDSLENAQLKLQRARGTDLTIFSPRASAMAHHIGNETTSRRWTQACNDLIHRVCTLYPDNFVGVCQLPQSPGVPPLNSAAELAALRGRIGIHRLQFESRSFRRALEFTAAHRSALVSPVRKNGGARCARDGARQFLVQSRIFTRPARTTSTPTRPRSCSFSPAIYSRTFPTLAVHHSARRRRGALPLGPVPRTGAGYETAAARRSIC